MTIQPYRKRVDRAQRRFDRADAVYRFALEEQERERQRERRLAPMTRIRRGKEVEIPEEWRGQVTHPQTIRKRPSKYPRKLRRYVCTNNARPHRIRRSRQEERKEALRGW